MRARFFWVLFSVLCRLAPFTAVLAWVVLMGLWFQPSEPGLSLSQFAVCYLPGLFPQQRIGYFSSVSTLSTCFFSYSRRPFLSSQWMVERANVLVQSWYSPLSINLLRFFDLGLRSWFGSCMFFRPWLLLTFWWSHSRRLTSSACLRRTSLSS